MKRLALGACVLTVLAACHEAGPPTSPSMSSPPAVDATARRFTVRNLGTLGGSFSVGVAGESCSMDRGNIASMEG